MADEIAVSVVDDAVKGSVSPLKFDTETYAQLLTTLKLISEDWPMEHDKGTYAMYLMHDCRDLAKMLTLVADEAEKVAL